MGGIEECKGSCCHGALMEMTANEYQKIWLSEGGGQADPGNLFICILSLSVYIRSFISKCLPLDICVYMCTYVLRMFMSLHKYYHM